MARPSKYNEHTRARILEALRSGMTRCGAAGYAKIDEAQIRRWCQRFASFAEECRVAEMQAVARFEGKIISSAAGKDGDPKMALEWLKRRRRVDWGDKIDVSVLSDEELITRTAGLLGGDIQTLLAGPVGSSPHEP